ncbi:MAG: Uma2 family endonuclease [Candidatus Eremiobacteraeota bacterium]|nr:Uma2 family endonuclease [Candidatus Eremiobacteraeota bacterium]
MTITLDLQPFVAWTEDEFFEFCQRHAWLKIERTASGALEIMTPTGGETSERNALLTCRLVLWARADGTGVAFDSSAGFLLPNGAERGPEASWVERSRWEALTPEQRQKFPPLCPDFVVELMSPSDSLTATRAKIQEYLDNGARLGWLLDPSRMTVEVFRPGHEAECVVEPAQLAGDPVLPGFVLELEGIL